LHQHPWAAAGTPEDTSARQWLKVQGSAITRVSNLAVGYDWCENVNLPGSEVDAARLLTLLASLPALTSLGSPRGPVTLRAHPQRTPTAAAVRTFLAGAARAVARCSGLRALGLNIHLLGGLADQVPEALVRELASLRVLEEVTLRFAAHDTARPDDWPVTFSLADLVAGLAGLPRLRALSLLLMQVRMEATLPASVSRLAQLTSLSLRGLRGLRCEPGWARLPALACLHFSDCEFAGDGEAALPGMDALAALTSLELRECPSLRLLPMSLWRLSQLHRLSHHVPMWDPASVLHSALPVAELPLSAPCFASLTHLALAGLNLRLLPAGALVCVSDAPDPGSAQPAGVSAMHTGCYALEAPRSVPLLL